MLLVSVISFIVGANLGVIIMSVLGANAYEKKYE